MKIQNITSYEEFKMILETYKYIIVNISATWCKPCQHIKPYMDKYMSAIDENNYIYIKIDDIVYESNILFHKLFHMKQIPYFGMIHNKILVDNIVSGDFIQVSMKIFNFIKNTKDKNMEADNKDTKNDI